MTRPELSPPAAPHLKALERFARKTSPGEPAWLESIRHAGADGFAQVGFPTTRQEDWRFTSLAPLSKLPLQPAEETARDLTPADLAAFPLADLPATRLVFVDGRYSARLSVVPTPGAGVQIGSLAATLAAAADLAQPYLGRLVQNEANPFVGLNNAFFQDGAFIHVPAGQRVEQPVHLQFISTGREAGATTHPRNLIVVGRGARLTVLESYLSTVTAPTLTNSVTEFFLDDQSVVEHAKFQDESPESFHLATLNSRLGRDVAFSSHSIVTGAKLSRNNIRTTLEGEGIECILNGVYLTQGEQLADHHMIVDHAQPQCASHEYFNGILAGKSRGVFHGRILVRPGAQKTDAKQTNKNLLLSDDASANTKPQLEIYADDVKCTHGATIGQLNQESIYYLRSRGLGLDTARRMLIHAFAGEIIDRIKHDGLRERFDALLRDRLEQII
ncbi:MAG TPA: Fe-S cluster assembly protein SufD [Candidatus Saccharimonadales bacterium]|nr:Fe-S cluster assembly protein SufD [Candidatus Saccharimonadales bacterium]